MDPDFLSIEEVLEMHRQQIELYGGSAGIRDVGLLEAAVQMPQASFGGQLLHQSIPSMAAAYLFHLCQNHPFLDGNKRVAANAAFTFLVLNDWDIAIDSDELVALVMSVASGNMDKPSLSRIFEQKCWPADGQVP